MKEKIAIRRRQYVSLGFGSDDGDSEEVKVYMHGVRGGDVEPFYRYNPEFLLLLQEEQTVSKAHELYQRITDRLSERQRDIWRLRADGISFSEIAATIDLCERSVFYEWRQIREIAHQTLLELE